MAHPSSGDAAHGKLLVVLPVITTTYADVCVESLLKEDSAAEINPDDVLVIDNSRDGFAAERYGFRTYRHPQNHNCGVARSWGIGAHEVVERGLDYLVIMSSVMQFGPILHTSWTRQMLDFWGERVIECEISSWHLIAFHREVFERTGYPDINYHPAYIEGLDMSLRMRQVGWEGGWRRVALNAMSQGSALHNAVVSCPAQPLLDYYEQKWGGIKGEERYTLPWGDKPLGYFEETDIPTLAARYNLGEYGVNWW